MRRFSILMILGLAAIAAGIIWLWQSGSGEPGPSPPDGRPPPIIHVEPVNEVVLFFADSESGLLIEVTREADEDPYDPEVVLAELLKGPQEGEAGEPTLPKGTKLLRATLEGSTVTVNLSREFREHFPASSAAGGVALYSLVNSLTSIEGVEKVLLKVEGEKVKQLGELDVSEPLERNPSFIAPP